jgi:septal ring factor EnvC (AmiA/AmiB activator)
LDEIGEISRDFAVTSSQLDKIISHLSAVINRQNDLTNVLLEISKTNADIINPNPKMIEIMNLTNDSLDEFNKNIASLNQTVNQLKREEVHIIVRQEIEKLLSSKINS